jgi:hypothetical protein
VGRGFYNSVVGLPLVAVLARLAGLNHRSVWVWIYHRNSLVTGVNRADFGVAPNNRENVIAW